MKWDDICITLLYYYKKCIQLNTILKCRSIDYSILKIKAIMLIKSGKYNKAEEILLTLSKCENKSDQYEIYSIMIQLYSDTNDKVKKTHYCFLAINLISSVYDNYNSIVYSLIYFADILFEYDNIIGCKSVVKITDDIMKEEYDNNLVLLKKDQYYYKLAKCKCAIDYHYENYLNIIVVIDELLSLSKDNIMYTLYFYQTKIDCYLHLIKTVDAYKASLIMEKYIQNKKIDGSILSKFYISKLNIAIQFADEQLFVSILNTIIYNRFWVEVFQISYANIMILKDNIPKLLKVFRKQCKNIIQVCICGNVNTTKGKYYKSFTLCKKCKSCYFCSKQCQQKYRKIHAKKCESIV